MVGSRVRHTPFAKLGAVILFSDLHRVLLAGAGERRVVMYRRIPRQVAAGHPADCWRARVQRSCDQLEADFFLPPAHERGRERLTASRSGWWSWVL
mmetsp:Transcript_53811/g.143190  ORF Transcript_53811/g.143190 Transcript_53811/m.143190 type:complete len:96 (+) Transcript_53811:1549-1836(+)